MPGCCMCSRTAPGQGCGTGSWTPSRRRSRCAGSRRCATSFPTPRQASRRPDPPGVLEATVRAAADAAREHAPDLPLVAGGKSLGGRMTSNAQARRPLPGVLGSGLPRLPAPSAEAARRAPRRAPRRRRAADAVPAGDARRRSPTSTSSPVSAIASGARATLHVVEGADHAFEVLKRSGRTDAEVMEELAETVASWCRAARP